MKDKKNIIILDGIEYIPIEDSENFIRECINDIKNECTSNKHDDNKTRYDLISWDIVEGIANVLPFGAKKYSENTWMNIENPKNRYFSAALRHFISYRNGEKNDKESGLPHLDHVACNIMFLKYFEDNENIQKDNCKLS